jgi:hypothetical protein
VNRQQGMCEIEASESFKLRNSLPILISRSSTNTRTTRQQPINRNPFQPEVDSWPQIQYYLNHLGMSKSDWSAAWIPNPPCFSPNGWCSPNLPFFLPPLAIGLLGHGHGAERLFGKFLQWGKTTTMVDG